MIPTVDKALALVLVVVLVIAVVVMVETGHDTTILIGIMSGPVVTLLLGALLSKRQAETTAKVNQVVAATNGALSGALADIQTSVDQNSEILRQK